MLQIMFHSIFVGAAFKPHANHHWIYHSTLLRCARKIFSRLLALVRPRSHENFAPAAKLHRGSKQNFLPVAMLRGGSHKN